MTDQKTREPQYQVVLDGEIADKRAELGLMINYAWDDDPRRLAFTFSRYKFIGKMLDGKDRVLEIGCGDGFVSRVVAQSVGSLTAMDFDPVFIEDAKARATTEKWPITFGVHDILTKSLGSDNSQNGTKAAIEGLGRLRSAEMIAQLRGVDAATLR